MSTPDAAAGLATLDPALQHAGTALREHNFGPAAQYLRVFLKANPHDVNALRMMAEVELGHGAQEDALRLLEDCVRLAPDFAEARFRYATVLVNLSKLRPAIDELTVLLRNDAANVNYKSLMAYALGQIGDYAQALPYHQEFLKERPVGVGGWMTYANDLRAAGRRADAIAAYRKVMALSPAFADAYWNLANLKTFRFAWNEVAAMQAQIARPDLPMRERGVFHFSLGKAFEDAGDYLRAFHHFERANAIHRKGVLHDRFRVAADFARWKTIFTKSFFEKRRGSGCAARDPIFIVGLPRSGSTLVEHILASHSCVEGTRELPCVQAIAARIDGSFPESLCATERGTFAAMGRDYLDQSRIFRRTERPLFTDKMPSNFAFVGFIHLILPNAKIIDVRRHPLDCCMSNFKQMFSRAFTFSYDFAELGSYYREYEALMAHFDSSLPGKVHRVVYERLVENPEGEIRRLLDHLELPFEERCLHFHLNDRAVRTASSEQVRMPIFTESVGSWRNYAPWIGPLRTALGDMPGNTDAPIDTGCSQSG